MTTPATIASALVIGSRIFGFDAFFGGKNGGQDIVLMVVLLIAAVGPMMLQLVISRQRELLADEHGARVNNSSEGLISALFKLDQVNNARPMRNANPATSNLFVVNPLGSRRVRRLFSTHPRLKKG